MKYLKNAADPAPPPHKRPAFQYYMAKFPSKVDAVYNERWRAMKPDKAAALAFRAAIAHELWLAEDQSFRAEIERERDEEHENDLRVYRDQQDALTKGEDETSRAG